MNGKNRGVTLALLVISALSTEVAFGRPPNVLLIMADDVGTETLGCYGGESYKTPHLDALAESGLRFRHCYSMPVCHPTRITLLTGKYPFRLNHPAWGTFPKAEESKTLARLMKNSGYGTAIVGKWQLTLLGRDRQHPHRLGFDQYSLFGWHEGPRYYEPMIWKNGKLRGDVAGRYGPDVYVEDLVDFMQANQDRPFFAFYSMALCHDVTDDLKQPVPFGPKGHYDSYADMLAAMDSCVGRLVAAVDRLGLREQTVILFTGDNGTSKSSIHTARNGKYIRKPVYSKINGKSVRGGKGELTNGGTNVPLIVSWKGTTKPRQVVDDLVDFSDFLPTCVDLADAKLPEGFQTDGHSFADRIRGKSAASRQWAYSEQRNKYWVRNTRWKLYNNRQLFDVRNDPQEKKPISAEHDSPASAAARKELTKVLLGLRKATHKK